MSDTYEIVSEEIVEEHEMETFEGGPGLPPGGHFGQVVTKLSDEPFHSAWAFPPGGSGGDAGLDFVQSTPAVAWIIAHNLGHYPVVELLTAGGARMLADITHLSINTLQVNFASPVSGRARLV